MILFLWKYFRINFFRSCQIRAGVCDVCCLVFVGVSFEFQMCSFSLFVSFDVARYQHKKDGGQGELRLAD